jgi:hypothetical protein
MEEEFVSEKDYNEIKLSKYGKKKNSANKSKNKYKSVSLISLTFLLMIIFITIIIYISKFPPHKINIIKETNSKAQNEIEKEISEKDKLNDIALKAKLRPYPMVQYILQRPNYALLNIFKFAKINKEDIDLEKLVIALNKTIYNHPVLLSRFHKDENGEIFMEYRPDLPPEIKILNIKDEDVPILKGSLLHKFEPFDSCMVNFTLFISETSIYFYYDIFHSNLDGNSISIFESNLELAYLGKPLPKDYYFLNLYEYNKAMTSKKYNDTVKFYQDNFNLTRDYCPKFDSDIPNDIKNSNSLQLIYKEYSSEELRKQLIENFGEKPRNYNIFMTMNILLTDYIYSNFEDEYPTAKIGFNGRNWKKDANAVGCHLLNYPVIYHFQNKKINMKKYYNKIKELFDMKPKLMRYPFEHTEKYSSMMAIMQTKNFYKEMMFGKKCENIYGYNNLINMKSDYVMSPIMQELFIDENYAKYSYFFDGKFYKESSADRFMDILIKTSKLIMNNFNNDKDIDLENYM